MTDKETLATHMVKKFTSDGMGVIKDIDYAKLWVCVNEECNTSERFAVILFYDTFVELRLVRSHPRRFEYCNPEFPDTLYSEVDLAYDEARHGEDL